MSSFEKPFDPRLLQETVGVRGQEASAGFALAIAIQICAQRKEGPQQVVWVRQDAARRETGDLYGYGLSMFGLDTNDLLVVHARTFADTLRAGLEVVRCPAVCVVLIETTAPADLTATRRLKLAAEKTGVTPILVRHDDVPVSNAANVRWLVGAAPQPARNTSGIWPPLRCPAFDVTLMKHPGGLAGRRWIVEWDHERRQFHPPLSLPVAAVSRRRSLAA